MKRQPRCAPVKEGPSRCATATDLSERWEAVWQILVEECGARTDGSGHGFDSFLHYMNEDGGSFGWEFRFMGNLGFGGKFYRDPYPKPYNGQPMRVSCYPEDRTPARDAAIERANSRLRSLLSDTEASPR